MVSPYRQLCVARPQAPEQDDEAEAADKAMIADLQDERVPVCLYWSVDNVVEWLCDIGFPQYQSCFRMNEIDGRKLIQVTMTTLPQMGICDYVHMKTIVHGVQSLLMGVKEPSEHRSVAVPPREPIALYLERKSHTGKSTRTLTYAQFLQDVENAKWQPNALANVGFILDPKDRIPVLALNIPRGQR